MIAIFIDEKTIKEVTKKFNEKMLNSEDDKKCKLPIKSIIIGPTIYDDMAEEGLKMLLEKNGYDTSKIKIKKSSSKVSSVS